MTTDGRAWLVRPDVMLPDPLLDALREERLVHAVLLIGTSGTTQIAVRRIAEVLLCTGTQRPCGVCASCVQFAAGVHPDFQEVGEGVIRTGDIEGLQRWLSMKSHGEHKVYTLCNVDSMTGVAANRILKTLEEPQPGVFALLTASQRQSVLSTIRSRAFIYELPASTDFVASDHQAVPLLQAVLTPTENDSFDGFVDKMLEWTEMLLVKREPALTLAATWQSYCDEVSAMDSLMLLAEWLRDILYTRVGALNRRFTHWENELSRFAPMLDVSQWTNVVDIVLDSRQRLQSHVQSLLNFEQMCIRLREVFT